jgi:hypothetical protein
MAGAAGISAIGGIIGGLINAGGASAAAGAQSAAAKKAIRAQLRMYSMNRQMARPFIQQGGRVYNRLQGELPELTREFKPTIGELERTPGYQFVLDQGLKGLQNSYAARGLATSGASLKGATDYATNLAATTYQQQLDNYMKQNQNRYNTYSGYANMGMAPMNALMNAGTTVGGGIGQNYTNIGNAQAGMYNSIGNTFGSLVGNQLPAAYAAMQRYGTQGTANSAYA